MKKTFIEEFFNQTVFLLSIAQIIQSIPHHRRASTLPQNAAEDEKKSSRATPRTAAASALIYLGPAERITRSYRTELYRPLQLISLNKNYTPKNRNYNPQQRESLSRALGGRAKTEGAREGKRRARPLARKKRESRERKSSRGWLLLLLYVYTDIYMHTACKLAIPGAVLNESAFLRPRDVVKVQTARAQALARGTIYHPLRKHSRRHIHPRAG